MRQIKNKDILLGSSKNEGGLAKKMRKETKGNGSLQTLRLFRMVGVNTLIQLMRQYRV